MGKSGRDDGCRRTLAHHRESATCGAPAQVRREDLPPWPAEPDPFRFLAPEYALPLVELEPTVCTHPRVTGKTYEFAQRGPAPLLAHQCVNCGDAVSVDEVMRRRRDRRRAGDPAADAEAPHQAA